MSSSDAPTEQADQTAAPAVAKARSPLSRVKAAIGWTFATLALTVAVSECGLRITGIEFPDFYAMDPVRGWKLRAGAEGMYRSEGNAFVSINSDGMRDREHAVAKPAGVYRIAFLGDSFTEALQVDASRTYWAEVERNLASCAALGGKKVEALNFGVSSYGTSNALLTLEQRGFKYEPDAVVLGFFVGNDFTDNTRALDHMEHRPYYTLNDGKLVLDTSISEVPLGQGQRAWHSLLHGSRIAQLVQKVKTQRGVARALREQEEAAKKATPSGAPPELSLEDTVFSPPKTDAWRDAWAITEALLTEVKTQSVAHHATFTLAVLSAPVQVDPDPTKRNALTQQLGVPDLFYPDIRLTAFGRSNGIPVVTIAPHMQQAAIATKTCFHGFGGACVGHWNEAGHKLAGEALAKAMCENLSRAPQ